MTNKLFIAGFPYSTTNAQLQELFATIGTVSSVNVVTDRYSGQSKGFGFIEMSSGEEAQQAITKLNNTMFGERTLVVKEALPKKDTDRNQDYTKKRSPFAKQRH